MIFVLTSCQKVSDTKVLYLAHNLPQTHPVHKGILEFQKALERNSKGSLKVKIFSDSQTNEKKMHLLDFAYNNPEDLVSLLNIAETKAIEHEVDLINLWLFDVENEENSTFKNTIYLKTEVSNKIINIVRFIFLN